VSLIIMPTPNRYEGWTREQLCIMVAIMLIEEPLHMNLMVQHKTFNTNSWQEEYKHSHAGNLIDEVVKRDISRGEFVAFVTVNRQRISRLIKESQ
jgi:hypothetical protein